MGTQTINGRNDTTESLMLATSTRPEGELERIPISKARTIFGQLVNRVHTDKDRIVLEKSGIPVAVLIDVEEYRHFLPFQKTQGTAA